MNIKMMGKVLEREVRSWMGRRAGEEICQALNTSGSPGLHPSLLPLQLSAIRLTSISRKTMDIIIRYNDRKNT